MFSIHRILKDWKEAASLNSYVNLYGFWDEEAFLTKSGDLGVMLKVRGSDYETDERTLLRDAMRRSMGDAPFADVRANYSARHAEGEFITRATPNSVTRLVTTQETLAAERQILDQMRKGQGQVAPIISDIEWHKIQSQAPHLNQSQRNAVREVLENQDRIMGIQGFAGSGKTTALETMRKAAEERGFLVEGFAPASR